MSNDSPEPTIMVLGGAHRRGRPPLDEKSRTPSADVHLTLPATIYDRADRVAKQRRESIQDVIRRGLTRLLADERG